MTTQVNRPLSQAEAVFKQIVWEPLFLAGETALFSAIPELNAPILGTIDKELLSALADWAFSQLVLFADVTSIKLINSAHQAAYEQASEELGIVFQEKGKDSPEYAASLKKAMDAMSAFTQFNRVPVSSN